MSYVYSFLSIQVPSFLHVRCHPRREGNVEKHETAFSAVVHAPYNPVTICASPNGPNQYLCTGINPLPTETVTCIKSLAHDCNQVTFNIAIGMETYIGNYKLGV